MGVDDIDPIEAGPLADAFPDIARRIVAAERRRRTRVRWLAALLTLAAVGVAYVLAMR